MFTYATVNDFIEMKDLTKPGVVANLTVTASDKIQSYLERATRFIDRTTRRAFFPSISLKEYPVPYAYYDLAVRRFPSAHLSLDADLLETIIVNNGIKNLLTTDYFLLENNIYPKTAIALNYPNYWGGLGGALKRYDQPTISITGIWGYADYNYPNEFWINTNEVVPIAGMTANQTTLVLTDIDADDANGRIRFSVGNLIRIDNEFMEVTAINTGTNTLTLIRGAKGSTAVVHNAGVVIKKWRVIEDIQWCCLQIAKIWREADLAAGSRIGVSDVSSGAELSIPDDPLKILKLYTRSII